MTGINGNMDELALWRQRNLRRGSREMLTSQALYANLKVTTEIKANHAKRVTASHGSNPTLNTAVNGLRSIISDRWILVRRAQAARLHNLYGLGRFVFRQIGEMYA